MTRQTTDKARALYNRLTNRYDRPDSPLRELSVTSYAEAIVVEAHLTNGRHLQHDLDPTRGVLDLNRQVVAMINQATA
ncbi:hypothetical protein SEA_JINKIES_66 [Arthrobacter phage Jinkies]|uniref:Uncharacterized protein n=1 Tax=Arthrobacter phage Jinkies TaxID=2743903 RepID=A0A7T0NAS2_9CAUD|nr:hypothetical protein SEA_JINKIES_66 [Arthrobacter phage Jinkies]